MDEDEQKLPVKLPNMEVNGAENGVKLRRGRISLERKKEILEQYDLLSKPCSETDAAAILGVTTAALSKILSTRDDITEAVTIKIEGVSSIGVDDSEGEPKSSAKLKRGRLSFEKKKELLALYDQLPGISNREAACKLGIREATLTKLLASRRIIGSRKRKKTADSSSDSDDYVIPRRVHSASSREAIIARLSPQPGGSGTRRSPQPGSSGLNMALRQGRRVRVDYSEDEQSGSDYKANDSDSTDGGVEVSKGRDWDDQKHRAYKRYSLPEKEKMLAKYDELACPQWRAAQILGITQSTLSTWLSSRKNSNSGHSQGTKIKFKEEKEDSGEEIDSYVMGSTNGTIVQFFEVNAEEDKKSNDSTGTNSYALTRKPHMTLREKFELYKKYDSMDPDSQSQAAATFNLSKSSWFNLIANRFYYEKRFKTILCKDMDVLKNYDELETKRNAAKVLNVPLPKLKKILDNRAIIEKYFTELLGSNDNIESIALSVEKAEPPCKDSKALKALETELLNWFKQAKYDQVIDWEVLKDKAKELAADSGMDDFYPSDAWLRKWNKTNRAFWSKKDTLVSIYGFGENRSVSECVLTALKDHPPENVFNLVETGLYYRAVRGYSPITNDWVTVAFACNMSGTEKKRPLVVGKSKAPLCFRVMSLPLEYKYSRSACMTREIFCNFLRDWNEELAESNRTIALILDSAASHPNVKLSRIHLFFVPMESSGAQPLSDGIVGQAKALYRKRMAESLQGLGSSRMSQRAPENITIVDALFALSEAWGNVPKSLLVSKFLKSTFPQNDSGEPEKEDLDDEELDRLNKLDNEIQLHSTTGRSQFSDKESGELEGDQVVHMEGTLEMSDEEEEDFDIDSLLRDEDTSNYNPNSSCGQNSTTDNLGSKLKNFLQKNATPNDPHAADQKGCGSPTVDDVRGALSTIKKFLQLNGCTLEDLTDYTQLEIKVLTKIESMSAASELS